MESLRMEYLVERIVKERGLQPSRVSVYKTERKTHLSERGWDVSDYP